MDFSKANEVMRYINDHEYKLGWDIPEYSKEWYREITTHPSKPLTQEHLDLYVASVQLILAFHEKKLNDSLEYYPIVTAENINSLFYKAYANERFISQVIQTFEKMEQSSTHEERLELYLSLHVIDASIIDQVYSFAKRSVDRRFEAIKRQLDAIDRFSFYKDEIKKLNDLKFDLRNGIDQKPSCDPVKNVEQYIEALEHLYQKISDDFIEEIDELLRVGDRSGGHINSLKEAKAKLRGESVEVNYPHPKEYVIEETFREINRYKAAPSIQPLKQVIDEAVKQYDEWLKWPFTEEEQEFIKEVKERAQSILSGRYIANEEDLNWNIQRVQTGKKEMEQYVQRYAFSMDVDDLEYGETFVPLSFRIDKEYGEIDSLANHIKVKVTSERGLVIPETVTLQNGQAQALFYPNKSEGLFMETITAEIIDAPPKYAYLIGQKVTRTLRVRS